VTIGAEWKQERGVDICHILRLANSSKLYDQAIGEIDSFKSETDNKRDLRQATLF
jgi:hypothetical protein